MRKIFLFCCIVFSSVASAKTYYASPSGNNSNPGTITQPWLTWSKAFQTAVAGDTVYFRGGKYPNSGGAAGETGFRSGIATDPICFINYPGEEPILDCSNKTVGQNTFFRAVSVWNVGYLYFKGLSITNVPQLLYGGSYTVTSGLDTYKSHHITYENLKISYVQGPGLGVYGCNEVYVKNCDVWEVCDSRAPNPGQNGVGFQWNSVVKFFDNTMYNTRIYFEGCRTWNFSDNGFAGPGVGYVEIKNCWAFNGAKLKGEGCGFKLNMGTYGDLVNPLCRLVVNCISAMNGGYGFSPNNYQGNTFNANIFNNTLYHNGYKGVPNMGYGFFILDYLGSTPAPNEKYCNNISFDNELGVNLVADKWTNTFNSWNTPPGATVSNADFLSLDWTEMLRPRKADGSLPDINFLKLAPGSDLIDKGTNVGLAFNGSAPDLGYSEAVTGSVTPTAPVYVSSSIQNVAPTKLEMTYNLSLADIVPAVSAFSVRINSVVRSIATVSVSGTKVTLTLVSPVVFGDVVTVSYSKPVTSPLQTPAGGQAATISAQPVTNNVNPISPVYVSSAIETATPAQLELTYNLSLSNATVPAASSFTVQVNGTIRNVNTVIISGTKVLLTLASPVVFGDVVTVAYTKPGSNPLQTPSGGQAATISAQVVTNKLNPVNPVYVNSVIENALPAVIQISYDITLANIVPVYSSFSVSVNSVPRNVVSVTVSGSKVHVTLSSPAVAGDVVKVSYNKPSTNPIQTPSGGQAANINLQSVLNNIAPVIPVYLSASVDNATPSTLEITYDLSLANIVPVTASFTVLVNSIARVVTGVVISGQKVILTLTSPVIYGDLVTFSYTKPATNPLQTPAGGQAATISAKPVTNNVNPINPVYVSSAIETATPAQLELTYNLSLSNVTVPAASSFTVRVNGTIRNVNIVIISGTKVLLTLASPVVFGDIVTVAYTKPATNPLQTPSGGQAATISAQAVTNKLNPVIPVYISSAIENATPSNLNINYDLSLANIVPATAAFTVQVNSIARVVSGVVISGQKVILTLTSPVIYGDLVTFSYTKPATNPLQTPGGGQAATISAQPVTNNVNPINPVYVSSAIETATPAQLELTYNLSLSNVTVPAASSFTVRVNGTIRNVNTVTISGTKVLLTQASPVVFSDVVTVAYTKPATNPLQTPSGGQAATISAQAVTNKLNPVIPVYVSSAIENATPSNLNINYDLSLANIVPATAAFTVQVNSVVRVVTGVVISGQKVILTLTSPVIYGDLVTFSYTKPATNPLQSTTGAQATNLTSRSVTIRVGVVNDPPVVIVNYPNICYSGFIGEIDASGSYDPNSDNITFEWSAPANIPVSSVSSSKIQFLAPVLTLAETAVFILRINDGKAIQSQNILISILPYKPELEKARITDLTAASYLEPYYPNNLFDNKTETIWSSDGYDQNVVMCLEKINKINHIMLAFPDGLVREACFDVYASADSIFWDPILIHATSCSFSGNFQVFEFPASASGTDYSFVKLVGQGSKSASNNYISEFGIFGLPQGYVIRKNPANISVFPNPANDHITISVKEPTSLYDFIRILDLSGTAVLEVNIDPIIGELDLPVSHFAPGFYCVQAGTKDMTFFVKKLMISR
jgi:uncharacterized repeat protein (TIGR02059 family)